jgi:hypothetical protein
MSVRQVSHAELDCDWFQCAVDVLCWSQIADFSFNQCVAHFTL